MENYMTRELISEAGDNKTTFFDMVCDRAKIVGLVVSGGTLFSALIIKANNILFAGVKGATRIPYTVSFIIFLLLLALGTAVLVKYSMDAYPFYNDKEDNDDEEIASTTIVPTQGTMVEAVPSNSTSAPVATTAIATGVGVAGASFAVNNIATNTGLFTPLSTINNIVANNNEVVLGNPTNAELARQVEIYNNYQAQQVEDTVPDDCCGDMLWGDVDGDGMDDSFIM